MVRDLVLVYLVGSCVVCALNVVVDLFRSVIRVCRACKEKALTTPFNLFRRLLVESCSLLLRRQAIISRVFDVLLINPTSTKESEVGVVCSQIDGCITRHSTFFSPFLY